MGPPEGDGHLSPAFSAEPEAEDQTSDAPVALHDAWSSQASHGEPRAASPALASTRAAFPAQERLSSTRASPTFAGNTRHRSRSFAAAVRLPALVRPSDARARKG